MKAKVIIVILASLLLGGCMSETTASKENILLETTELSEEVESEESYMEENILFFTEQLGLTQYAAEVAAETMEEAGCGLITGYENKIESEEICRIILINSEGNKFETVYDLDGYMGPIKDENGNYLYYTVD